jgi:nitrous oxide reductase accessory protein NosL
MGGRASGIHFVLVFGLIVLAVAQGCGPGEEDRPSTGGPEPIGDQACAVCGMIVRDQSAPRGQVVHRDGTRLYVCSVSDLLVHLSVPSPHGTVREIYVEVMDAGEDPTGPHAEPHEWVAASDASYVVGVERTGIMGPPVLAYRDAATAKRVAERFEGTRVLDLADLKTWWLDVQGGGPASDGVPAPPWERGARDHGITAAVAQPTSGARITLRQSSRSGSPRSSAAGSLR